MLNHFFGVTHSRSPATLTNLKLEWSIICAKPRTTVSHFANPNHNQLGMIRIAELTQTSIGFHVIFLCFASWFADQLHMANSVPSVGGSSRTTAQRLALKKCGAVEELVHLLQMTYSVPRTWNVELRGNETGNHRFLGVWCVGKPWNHGKPGFRCWGCHSLSRFGVKNEGLNPLVGLSQPWVICLSWNSSLELILGSLWRFRSLALGQFTMVAWWTLKYVTNGCWWNMVPSGYLTYRWKITILIELAIIIYHLWMSHLL
jgi:hypothetical protein